MSLNDRYLDRFAQSGVPQAVVALDGTIAAVNAATCALFDRTADELIGEHLLDRVPTDGRDEDARLLAAVLSGRPSEPSSSDASTTRTVGGSTPSCLWRPSATGPAGYVRSRSACRTSPP